MENKLWTIGTDFKMKLHQHGNEIIVTELRPMSEIPEDVYVLVHDGISLYETRAVQGEMKDGTGEFVSDRLGWIQMPQYRPELKQTKEDIHNYYGA